MSNRSAPLSPILLATALAVGCAATVPMAPPSLDLQMKTAAPPGHGALVYVYRNESFGGGVKMPLFLDGQPAGVTVAKSYTAWQVAPGPHEILSKAENESRVRFDAAAGRAYYFWQEVKMGVWKARSELHAVDEVRGRAGVSECQLIAAAHPGTPAMTAAPLAPVAPAPPAAPPAHWPAQQPTPVAAWPAPPPTAPPAPPTVVPAVMPVAPAPPAPAAPPVPVPAAPTAPLTPAVEPTSPTVPSPAAPAPMALPPTAAAVAAPSALASASPAPPHAPVAPSPAPSASLPAPAAFAPAQPAPPLTGIAPVVPSPPVAVAPVPASPPATAVSAPADLAQSPGAERHDGFFLRFGFGPGYAAAKEDTTGGKLSGTSATGFLAIGWSPLDDFALHLNSEVDFMVSSKVQLPSGRESRDKSNVLRNVGLGASYYLMPLNLYFSAAVTAAQGNRQPEGSKNVETSKWGLGGSLTLGQEWWLSANWGLGLFARFHLSSFDGASGKDTYTTNVLTLGASATYN